jgi:hypothetical protein
MTSCRELFAGFGDAGLDGGDELKGIVLVPTRETAMLALKFLYLGWGRHCHTQDVGTSA